MSTTPAADPAGDAGRSTSSPASGPRWTRSGTPPRTPTSTSAGTSASARSPTSPRPTASRSGSPTPPPSPPASPIAGTGESLGDRDRPDGTRWSGLKFWADDRRSIIDAGAGYWRYVPTDDGIRFLTRYDYRPRWGRFGELVDRARVPPGVRLGHGVELRPAAPVARGRHAARALTRPGGRPRRRRRRAGRRVRLPGPGPEGLEGRRTTRSAIWQGLGLGPSRRPAGRCGRSGAVEAGFAVATARPLAASAGRSSSPWPRCRRLPSAPPSPTARSSPRRSTPARSASPWPRSPAWPSPPSDGRPSGRRPASRLLPTASPTWRTCHDLDLPTRPRRRLRAPPPADAVALRVLLADETCQIGTGRHGRGLARPVVDPAVPAARLDPAGPVPQPRPRRARSPSRTTPTSTASDGRRSPGRGGSTSRGRYRIVRRHDDPQQAARHDRRLPRHPPAPRRRHRTARSTTRAPCASAAASSASTRDRSPSGSRSLFSGVANVREWWDEDAQRFRIEVHVANKLLGPLFGYRGSFTVAEHPCADEDIPLDVRPSARRSGSSPTCLRPWPVRRAARVTSGSLALSWRRRAGVLR